MSNLRNIPTGIAATVLFAAALFITVRAHSNVQAPDAAAFYIQKMGFREAFRNSDAQGNPTAIYIQVSKGTFIELQQSTEQRPAGINHFGMEAPDIQKAVAFFKGRGAMATEPGAPSAFSKARLANVTDLNGLRIELAELGPESLQRKAMESWK